jgi:hypothetical protein
VSKRELVFLIRFKGRAQLRNHVVLALEAASPPSKAVAQIFSNLYLANTVYCTDEAGMPLRKLHE